jgi:hypothetical protein
MALVLLLVLAASAFSLPASLAMTTSPYVRPAPRETLCLLRDDDADGQTPQQVITPLNWLDALVTMLKVLLLVLLVIYTTRNGLMQDNTPYVLVFVVPTARELVCSSM